MWGWMLWLFLKAILGVLHSDSMKEYRDGEALLGKTKIRALFLNKLGEKFDLEGWREEGVG